MGLKEKYSRGTKCCVAWKKFKISTNEGAVESNAMHVMYEYGSQKVKLEK